ncbi:hypothetical protein GLOIN_2v1788498 [Rhizophagus clarus]|uniref:RNase H type-1 domain-containing protein n=1 Tax=Rhizophagus clarus TaxID=94130 RepID=A0A8H3LIM3_9GLOM|nr:hypothetical protein GLOIN_2v1788498 [Rhizophagus clarus]
MGKIKSFVNILTYTLRQNVLIPNASLRYSLIRFNETINNNKTEGETLNFYTDGSLQQDPINNMLSHYVADNVVSDMGAGVYLKLQNNTIITTLAKVAAELNEPHIRAKMKQPNALVIIKIKMVCKEKHLNLDLVKVKGHDRNEKNEIADRLAKESLNSDNIFDSKINFTNHDIRFFPAFKDIPIETNLQCFIL